MEGTRCGVARITAIMRFVPFLLLHLRHAIMLYAAGRLLCTMAMAFATGPTWGIEFLALMPLLTALLLYLDRRRTGAPDLYANLGYGSRELLGMGAATALVGELLVVAIVMTVAGG